MKTLTFLLTLTLVLSLTPALSKTLKGGVSSISLSGRDKRLEAFPLSVQNQPLKSDLPFQNYSHGSSEVGVLGSYTVTTAKNELALAPMLILSIEKFSDLNRFGVIPGDLILSVDGIQVNNSMLRTLTRGVPGSPVNLVVSHQGTILNLVGVRRMSSAYCQNSFDGYYDWCKKQNIKW